MGIGLINNKMGKGVLMKKIRKRCGSFEKPNNTEHPIYNI